MTSEQSRIKKAIDLYHRDPEAALAQFRYLTEFPASAEWAEAHVAIARHELGHANYRAAIDHLRAVIDTTTKEVSSGLRGVAAILYCDATDCVGEAINATLLEDSIEAALDEGQYYDGANGLQLLAWHKLQANDRTTGRALLERAVLLYDQAGSMLGGPAALERLTRLDLEDGNLDQAKSHLELALARLGKFPLGGMDVKLIEGRLLELRNKIPHE